jgi:hypothetical protein
MLIRPRVRALAVLAGAAGLVSVLPPTPERLGATGCTLDFDDHLRPFYSGSCGFTPTNAGPIAL